MLLVLLYTHRQKTIVYISGFKQGKALQLRHTHTRIFNFKKDLIISQRLFLTPELLFPL